MAVGARERPPDTVARQTLPAVEDDLADFLPLRARSPFLAVAVSRLDDQVSPASHNGGTTGRASSTRACAQFAGRASSGKSHGMAIFGHPSARSWSK